jgi:membrane protein
MLASIAEFIWHKRIIMSIIVLTLFFMGIYRILPDRKSSFLKQWPGALVAAIGWIVVSVACSLFMDGFTSFSYVYGSMAGIMIVLLWLYFCMSMVFYGAEFNFFLENKEDYHVLVWAFRHTRRVSKRRREELKRKRKAMREAEKAEAEKETRGYMEIETSEDAGEFVYEHNWEDTREFEKDKAGS